MRKFCKENWATCLLILLTALFVCVTLCYFYLQRNSQAEIAAVETERGSSSLPTDQDEAGADGASNSAGTDMLDESAEAVGNEGFSEEESDSAGGAAHKKININTASEEDLQTLSGIGPAKAAAIVEYREAHGGFQSLEELLNVEGIGEYTLSLIVTEITLE